MIPSQRQFRRLSARHGLTLFEIMIASSIAALMMGSGVYLTIFTLRAFRVLHTQMRSQVAASQGMQNAAARLRNAQFQSISIYREGNDVGPMEAGDAIVFRTLDSPTTESLRFEETTLYYRPNVASDNEYRMVRDLETVRFVRLDNQMIQVEAEFKYPKFRGFGSDEAVRMNGTFVTRVFPRNY